jgi:hypothetical protein
MFNALLQIVVEMLVDVVCLRFERHTDPRTVWASMSKRIFVLMFMLSSWYGIVGAVGFFYAGDSLVKCQGSDMCHCVNHGLMNGGVREAYCKIIYPNASWDARPFPTLGSHVTAFQVQPPQQ